VTEELELPDGRHVRGFVDEGYGPVFDAFVAGFVDHQDLGAACSAYVDGRLVVNLSGGLADRRSQRPWRPDTTAVTFSCSKGLLAICVCLLAQEGRLDLDVPIAVYWPTFGEHGKSAITIREAMSHRAGLPALDVDLTLDEVLAWDPVIRAIEAQQPLYPPSAGHFYHAMVFGWLVGEVIRCVTGKTPGRYFRHALAIASASGPGSDSRKTSGHRSPGWRHPSQTKRRRRRARVPASSVRTRSSSAA